MPTRRVCNQDRKLHTAYLPDLLITCLYTDIKVEQRRIELQQRVLKLEKKQLEIQLKQIDYEIQLKEIDYEIQLERMKRKRQQQGHPPL